MDYNKISEELGEQISRLLDKLEKEKVLSSNDAVSILDEIDRLTFRR